jgi:hypothetical protein
MGRYWRKRPEGLESDGQGREGKEREGLFGWSQVGQKRNGFGIKKRGRIGEEKNERVGRKAVKRKTKEQPNGKNTATLVSDEGVKKR